MTKHRVTLERTRTIVERTEVEVEALTWEDATMKALDLADGDLPWAEQTCNTDTEALTCERVGQRNAA